MIGPLPPVVNILEQLEDSVDINLNRTTYFNMVNVTATSADGSKTVFETVELKDDEDTLKVKNLTAGTHYNVTILPIISIGNDTIEGLSTANVSTFTRKFVVSCEFE